MRFDLRRETAPLHENVDAAFGALDLEKRSDYRRFIQAHRLAARAAEGQLNGAENLPAIQLSPLLEADAAALDLPEDDWQPPTLEGEQHPLGIAYVLLGSRLGNRLLQRGEYWAKHDPHGSRSDHYLSDRTHEPSWRALVEQLGRLDSDEKERAAIMSSAAATFAAFEEALRHSLDTLPE